MRHRCVIPRGHDIRDFSKVSNRTRHFPCTYAFLKEKGSSSSPSYTYSFSVLQQSSAEFLEKDEEVPVVRLDWRIGNQNCSRARLNSAYACQANTECVDFGAGIGGYRCECSRGYVGNPYLSLGYTG